MKTQHTLTVEDARSHLYDRVAQGYVIHGSPYVDLDTLEARETKFLHVDDLTGNG
jgi:hypothetical protein